VNILFFPASIPRTAGAWPRRYADYPEAVLLWNQISSIGYAVNAGRGACNLLREHRVVAGGRKAKDYWGGERKRRWKTLSVLRRFHQFKPFPQIKCI